jgi:protein-S-isoprenylcysteine O-methyltransferase Ste14
VTSYLLFAAGFFVGGGLYLMAPPPDHVGGTVVCFVAAAGFALAWLWRVLGLHLHVSARIDRRDR